MRKKGFLAAVLALALLLPLGTVPARAAGSSFSDVSDSATAVNADVLRLMGVVDGVGGNRFNPNAGLTRAEFCTMVVKFMGRGNEVPLHTTRTIFTDVTAEHWALGFVNLAASITFGDGEEKSALISGVGDGRFEPDAKLSMGQATTILLRVLQYSSQQTGAVWPQSYMNLAQSIGLTSGVSAGAYDSITRAQAAQLFVNALSCKMGDGSTYYQSLGNKAPKENVVLLAVGVDTDDGSQTGAVRTSDGTYLPQAGSVKPAALQGRRGTLVLNSSQEIVTFVPDDSTSVTITLSADAQPTYVKAGGQQYTISSATTVYTADKAEGSSYVDAYSTLKMGAQLTLFSDRGKIVAIYAAGAGGTSTDAVVVMDSPSSLMFQQLTGGASGYTVRKSGQTVALTSLKPYDVVTYDSMTNTLIASDLRLTCVYEDAYPSARAPEKIRVLGHDFDVLECAWDSIGEFSLGSKVSLLLTADGKVAGMAKATAQTSSTAVGVVTGSTTAQLLLPGGGTITLTGSGLEGMEDNLVILASDTQGRLSVSHLASNVIPGSFEVKAMKLGSYTVAGGVRVYEQVGSATVPIALDDLDMESIPVQDIQGYRLNSSSQVDYIVLKAITGDAYTYGILREGEQTSGGTIVSVNRTVTVENRAGSGGTMIAPEYFKDGVFGGVAKGSVQLDGMNKAASVIVLTEIKNVSPSDFFENQGITYVNAGGRIYRVADGVECYKNTTKDWFGQESGQQRLSACKAFSSNLTVYVDPVGEKVRIVAAN